MNCELKMDTISNYELGTKTDTI